MLLGPHPGPLDSGSQLRSTSSIPGVVPQGEGEKRNALFGDRSVTRVPNNDPVAACDPGPHPHCMDAGGEATQGAVAKGRTREVFILLETLSAM